MYNDKIVLDGELQFKFLYLSNITNRIEMKIQNIPFSTNVDCAGVLANSNINNLLEISAQNVNIQNDGNVDISVDLNITSDISKMMEAKVIDSIEIEKENNENIYSIVVYFVKPGDTLWNIAKKFRSTTTAIASVNGIEDENKLNVGQQLFIPKFV